MNKKGDKVVLKQDIQWVKLMSDGSYKTSIKRWGEIIKVNDLLLTSYDIKLSDGNILTCEQEDFCTLELDD